MREAELPRHPPLFSGFFRENKFWWKKYCDIECSWNSQLKKDFKINFYFHHFILICSVICPAICRVVWCVRCVRSLCCVAKYLDINYSCNFEMMTPHHWESSPPLNSTEKRSMLVIWSVTGNKKKLKCVQCNLNQKFRRKIDISKIWGQVPPPSKFIILNLFGMPLYIHEWCL